MRQRESLKGVRSKLRKSLCVSGCRGTRVDGGVRASANGCGGRSGGGSQARGIGSSLIMGGDGNSADGGGSDGGQK
jgi:hypothetical protein